MSDREQTRRDAVDREQTRRDEAAAGLRDQIMRCVPSGFRDEDGVWHDGPHRAFALACLDSLLAELEQAERERDAYKETLDNVAEAARINTELHSLRWLLGLDTHEGEKPQPREESHRNLDALLDKK